MTREEAIKEAKDVLKEITEGDNSVCYLTSNDAEWVNMAINALEQDDLREVEL